MIQDTGKAAEVAHLAPGRARRRELLAFLVLGFGIWPIVAVGVVGERYREPVIA